MRKCPYCGRATARTEDWACRWCGSPLLSKFYKKIPKTFKQLKEEELHKPESSVGGEAEASLPPNHTPLPPTNTAEPKPIPEPKQVQEPEQVPESKPEPIPEPKQVQEPDPELLPTAKEATVEQLISAYTTDAAAADAEFVNKILKLTGVMTKIEVNDILDVHYIVLSCAEKEPLQSVRCIFSKSHGPELNRLIKQQAVTVQGKYDGSIIAMRMRDCVLIL